MKQLFISDLHGLENGSLAEMFGWVKRRRSHGGVVFIDLTDSTGVCPVVVERKCVPTQEFALTSRLALESAVRVTGTLVDNIRQQQREILADHVELISPSRDGISPAIRGSVNMFSPQHADHLLSNRHLYIRNPVASSILRFRSLILEATRDWFRRNRFYDLSAPVLTPLPLYDDGSAIGVTIHDDNVFLTQCVGFYLEAAVHALERVYNMGPSFRGEESRSPRHLMEYWHIKAEVAWADLDDIMRLVEELIQHLTIISRDQASDLTKVIGTAICLDGIAPPFPRITYREAIERLQRAGYDTRFGISLNGDQERALAKDFHQPFWIVGIPRIIEPFPYRIDPADPEACRVADLILTNGYGELLGVAEKITDPDELRTRMLEKGKADLPQYAWVRELRDYGCVPHAAFGMGVERLMRWLLQLPHVRDMIPFPRIFRRRINP